MDLRLQIRRPDLTLWGEIPPEILLGFEADLVFRKLGTWKVTLPAGLEVNPDDGLDPATALGSPGWGVVVTNATGGVLLSGPTAEATYDQSVEDPAGTWTISGEDDTVLLADMLSYPTPTTAAVEDVQLGTGGEGYDVRTGPAETVTRAYINANVGPSAPAGRRLPSLVLAADTGAGATVTGQGRFQQLGELAETLSQAGGGIGFRIAWSNGTLVASAYAPRNLTGLIRLDVANGTLRSVSRTVRRPEITRAIVAGAGEDADQTLLEVTTTDSLAAEELWGYGGRGRRVERFIAQGSTDDPDELAQAGVEALADTGSTITSCTVEPVDTDDVQLGREYWLGDRVTIVVGAVEIQDVIAGAQFALDSSGFTAKAVLGDPSTAIRDPLVRDLTTARARAQRRLGRLERR